MEAFVVKIFVSLLIIVLITSNVVAEKLSMESKFGKRQTVSCKIQQFLHVDLIGLSHELEKGKLFQLYKLYFTL